MKKRSFLKSIAAIAVAVSVEVFGFKESIDGRDLIGESKSTRIITRRSHYMGLVGDEPHRVHVTESVYYEFGHWVDPEELREADYTSVELLPMPEFPKPPDIGTLPRLTPDKIIPNGYERINQNNGFKPLRYVDMEEFYREHLTTEEGYQRRLKERAEAKAKFEQLNPGFEWIK